MSGADLAYYLDVAEGVTWFFVGLIVAAIVIKSVFVIAELLIFGSARRGRKGD